MNDHIGNSKYYDLAPKRYTVVDAEGEHFGYGLVADLNEALTDVNRLNADRATMAEIATGTPEFYTSPFRAVLAVGMRGRIAELPR